MEKPDPGNQIVQNYDEGPQNITQFCNKIED